MFRYVLKNYMNNNNNRVLIIRHFSSVNANANFNDKTIELHITKNNTTTKHSFPFVWLRDNCKCDACLHKASSSRIINWEQFDLNVKPKSVEYHNERKILKIKWNDKDEHISEFSYEWLEARNFSKSNREEYLKKFYCLPKKLWGKNEYSSAMEYFDFTKILESDLELYKWLKSFSINGIATITGVSSTENEVRKIADRVGFIRKTHYGEEFMVKAKDNTSNVAYLSSNLQMHTDLPYYEYVPGVNLLHCLVQSKSDGAQNLLVDGFYIAEKLRKEYPKEFKLLTTVLIDWSDIGQEDEKSFHSIYRAPMICTDYDGRLTRINHSIPQRDSFFAVPIEEVQEWYKALSLFIKLIYDEAIELKTKEGTILCFDNRRAVHGRKQYIDTDDNCRHIIGAYLDWDEIYSKLRVLQKKYDENFKYVI
ncbi:hypothetical protein PVAND_010712 [Polypedilum vanderplanki]|uniref:Gamma-butyrobetaine dioxygenase n=1 Tax=Polypedilum vanderplanki TaxID=319348 RepID=A0A9J6CH45_POLVA|nr:hypothetical protein PVAND_010712 [Polypedilum vanderplanki]